MSITPFPAQGQYPWYDQLEQWGADTQSAAESAELNADALRADVATALSDSTAASAAAIAAAGLVDAPAGDAVLAAISEGGAARNELNATFADKSTESAVSNLVDLTENGRLSEAGLVNTMDERIQNVLYPDDSMGGFADWAALYVADELPLGPLAAWGDSSGNGYDLTNTVPKLPEVVSWVNSRRAVKFNASPLAIGAITGIPAPFTVVVVGDIPNIPGWLLGGVGAQINRSSAATTPPGEYRMGSPFAPYNLSTGVVDGNPHIFIAAFDGDASRLLFGNHDTTASLGASTITDIKLGGHTTSANDLIDGHIAAFGLVAGRLSPQQVASIRDWCNVKYGVL